MPLDGNPTDFETVTKTEVFSLEGLAEWLGTQDPAQGYVWSNCNGQCLLHQYLTARGKDWVRDYKRISKVQTSGPLRFLDGDVAMGVPRTFGGALSRARHLLSQS